jgi:hypothetical protein
MRSFITAVITAGLLSQACGPAEIRVTPNEQAPAGKIISQEAAAGIMADAKAGFAKREAAIATSEAYIAEQKKILTEIKETSAQDVQDTQSILNSQLNGTDTDSVLIGLKQEITAAIEAVKTEEASKDQVMLQAESKRKEYSTRISKLNKDYEAASDVQKEAMKESVEKELAELTALRADAARTALDSFGKVNAKSRVLADARAAYENALQSRIAELEQDIADAKYVPVAFAVEKEQELKAMQEQAKVDLAEVDALDKSLQEKYKLNLETIAGMTSTELFNAINKQ